MASAIGDDARHRQYRIYFRVVGLRRMKFTVASQCTRHHTGLGPYFDGSSRPMLRIYISFGALVAMMIGGCGNADRDGEAGCCYYACTQAPLSREFREFSTFFGGPTECEEIAVIRCRESANDTDGGVGTPVDPSLEQSEFVLQSNLTRLPVDASVANRDGGAEDAGLEPTLFRSCQTSRPAWF